MNTLQLRVTLHPILEEDIETLTPIMTRAFDDDAQKHLGQPHSGPEGYDNGDFFRKWLFGYQESQGFKVVLGDQVIGGIIVWILPERHNILGTIFIEPAFQDQGVGATAWQAIENQFPQTRSWRLGTPSWALKNHHFYRKCGFHVVETDSLISAEEGMTLYYKACHPKEILTED